MPFDTTTQTRPEGLNSSSRDHAQTADAALLMVAAPEQVKTGLRPVTAADPAWFITGRVGKSHPDYGKVFAFPGNQMTRYFFDRDEDYFAGSCPAPDGEWLEVQGRLFKIVSGAGQ